MKKYIIAKFKGGPNVSVFVCIVMFFVKFRENLGKEEDETYDFFTC